jgi:hypothetical protein
VAEFPIVDLSRDLSLAERKMLDNHFSYHPPQDDGQVQAYQRVREAGQVFAAVLLAEVPPGPDRSAAYRKIREAVMTANAGIACDTARSDDQGGL